MRTAIAILDRDGTKGLTLRGLAAELGGGLGSVYWYVDGKDEVLTLACDALIGEALARTEAEAAPAVGPGPATEARIAAAVADVRNVALAFFAQTQAHPWLAPQLQAQSGGSPNSLRYWERIGGRLAEMGLTTRQQFHGSTAITGYVVGVSAEMASQDIHADDDRPRDEQLDEILGSWIGDDPANLPWIRSILEEFRDHDDTEQFAAGLDLLLDGLVRQAAERAHG